MSSERYSVGSQSVERAGASGSSSRIQADEALEPTPPAPPRSSSRAPDSDKALAQAIHRDLHRGSVKKAARRPNAEPVAAINPETLQKLSDLHSDPPRVAPPDDPPPLLLTHRVLKKVMKRFPSGSAAGPSGFTFEHLKAALQGSRSCRDRTIEFVNQVIGDEMPPMPEMLASRLVALQKSKGGIRPMRWVRCGCAFVPHVQSCFVTIPVVHWHLNSCLLYTSPSPRD